LNQGKIRLVDEKGKQIGVLFKEEALNIAKERGFDLIEVTRKTEPPIYKLGDYSKIKYEMEKKLKQQKLKERQAFPKSIRIGFKESNHDLSIKSKKAEEFLKEGKLVHIVMILRGREKAHFDLAKEKVDSFLTLIKISYKIIRSLKKSPRGLNVAIKKSF